VGYSRPEPLGAEHSTQGFTCGEAALDTWLDRYARHAEATGSARTFVTTDDGVHVVGYYALTVGQVESAEATDRLLKGQPSDRSVPVAILARLAVDRRCQGEGVGRSLLQDALLRTHGVSKEMGIRALLVHALTEEAAGFYARFGFEPSPLDPLQMFLLMKDLAKLLGPSG
jgi:GNAT superfamily N-acetyltransferase